VCYRGYFIIRGIGGKKRVYSYSKRDFQRNHFSYTGVIMFTRKKFQTLGSNTPLLPFWSDCCLWVDGADPSAFTLGASNLVLTTRDKSPAGNHPTQATGTKQPTFTPNALNSNSVLSFDGGDTLVLPSGLYDVPNGDNTIVAVAKRTTEAGTAEYIINMSESAASRYYVGFAATSGNLAYLNKSAETTILTRTGNANTTYQAIRGRREGTTMAVTANGLSETTSANALSENGVSGAWLGSRRDTDGYLTGFIAEVVMWKRSLQPAELAQVESYLARKWGILLYR
jgi:hypothetical protein